MDKKSRSVNFVAMEIELLCNLVEKYQNVIENKKSDAVTWKQKDDTWHKIEGEFNSRAVGVFRSAKTLKLKYETVKKTTRKKLAQIRSELNRTGDKPSTALSLNSTEEKVKSMIILSVEGMKSSLDSNILPNYSVEDKGNKEMKEINRPSSVLEASTPTTEEQFSNSSSTFLSTPAPQHTHTLQNMWHLQSRKTIRNLKRPVLRVSSYRSKLKEIEERRMAVINIQKKIATIKLRMKKEEEKQIALRWECEARQREREEKIKEIDLEIKKIDLEINEIALEKARAE